MEITGAYVRVRHDGRWVDLDIAELTDKELDILFMHTTAEKNAYWAKFLAGWIRDNVKLTNPPDVLK